MVQLIERAYRYRFYPTDEQKHIFAKTFGCCRYVYNYFLHCRTLAWKEKKERLTYTDCSRTLTTLKEQYSWLKEVSSVTLQQSLRHLDKAFNNFFSKKSPVSFLQKKKFSAKSQLHEELLYL